MLLTILAWWIVAPFVGLAVLVGLNVWCVKKGYRF